MQRVRSTDQGMVGQRLTEDGQTAAVQGQSGDRRDQHDGLVEDDEDDRRGSDVVGTQLPHPAAALPAPMA